jgi:hypothetical protein
LRREDERKREGIRISYSITVYVAAGARDIAQHEQLRAAERARLSSLGYELGFEHVGSQRFGATAAPQSAAAPHAKPKGQKSPKSVPDFLTEKVAEFLGKVTVVALGPFTNIALVSDHFDYTRVFSVPGYFM